ncbi:MAG: glutamate-cysteine ligase family protein [Nitriliruptorales bacterium]|nr:glutamate-cysteine ligase family protein [Nitriliruptorales bacterium]
MPTRDDARRLRHADVHDIVAAAAFPTSAPDDDAIGIESEWFAVGTGPTGTHRLLLDPTGDQLGVSGLLAAAQPVDGVRHQTEPGAQVEAATAPRRAVGDALGLLREAGGALADAAAREGAVLLAAGIDLWHEQVPPQQSRAPRYPAMASYLASRGPAGAVMMRHTASLQLNVDLGRGDVAAERWAASLLAAPVSLATFATSPSLDGALASRRARVWASVDPTRTGIPKAFVDHPSWTPGRQLADAAMNADVLLVRHADGSATPGRPGWRFADWVAHGHPTHGWPTPDDLRYHLTTLFHEVRPRGWLELRSLDALPARWREPAVVLHAGLLLDTRARQRILEVLEPTRSRGPQLLARAARQGVADPSFCALAVEVWSFALDGAKRLGDAIPADAIRDTEQFIDRFTLRGRCPADAMREAFRQDPRAALDLAAEPSQRARVPA